MQIPIVIDPYGKFIQGGSLNAKRGSYNKNNLYFYDQTKALLGVNFKFTLFDNEMYSNLSKGMEFTVCSDTGTQ